MCGIGIIIEKNGVSEDIRSQLETMETIQLHRGPDYQGIYIDEVDRGTVVGLCHQRLSILDLSFYGNQPMISPCGRYVLVYNGEIYNYQEIARRLDNDLVLSLSTGDTVVVMAALIRWGASALNQFNGMWALAFYDRLSKSLLISRDRMGIKPLYIYTDIKKIIIASEVKTIASVCGKKLNLHRDSVARYLTQSVSNDTNHSFFNEIQAVPPSSFAKINVHDIRLPDFSYYWQHPYEMAVKEKFDTPSEEEIETIFIDSVKLRLRSDVPVGIMLSGGVDSSAILAAAKQIGDISKITALSVVSDDPILNEEPYIDAMLSDARCAFHKIKVHTDPHELLNEIPNMCWYNDQPLVNFSTVAHYKMMVQAKKLGITVLLTGQGADEQLGGYNKFLYFYLIDCIRRARWSEALSMIFHCIKLGTILPEFTIGEAKRYLPGFRNKLKRSHIGKFLNGAKLASTGIARSYQERELLDIRCFSIPTLLHYEDRMSMSCSREIRVPFLDYRLVELFARISPGEKLNKGWTKAKFRRAMRGLIPGNVLWRKDKKGFSIPEKQWLRSQFKPEFTKTFKNQMISVDLGIINRAGIQKLYGRYLKGDTVISYKELFNVYCLEMWLRRFEPYLAIY